MDKKSSEKDPIDKDEESKSLIQKIYSIIRENWLPLLCALIISIITIIVVPIIYSIKPTPPPNNGTNLEWNVTGILYIDQYVMMNKISLALGEISALSFDQESYLYIVDKTNHRILKIEGDQIRIIVGHPNGTNGTDMTSLNFPNDIYIDQLNDIYIADTENHRIQLWKKESSQITTIFGKDGKGSGNNQLNRPMSVTTDNDVTIYIADYGNDRIVSFNINNSQAYTYLTKQDNQERNQYVITPISIAYDSKTQTIVIAQELGYNVIRWNTSSTYWTLIAGSASSELSGTSRTLFNKLRHIYVDRFGHLYVTDCFNQRIQFFKYSPNELVKGRTIAGVILAIGNNPYIFNNPTAMTLDRSENLYVADSLNYRVQSFEQQVKDISF
ncbi:unnamed protein product [Rotaria sordida]|uniref:NHL repeat containing protein n=1 Tax=Rotaria sordida TaxID=392033 RepID=A0A814SHY4_9BILA|nr:unnamed protein product [Rotaria sordida]CAF1147040.1 unnamed protein product [Rotaria sordida]CAF1148519.1 unnamed protein product [Rotaria sordida]